MSHLTRRDSRKMTYLSDLIGREHDDVSALVKALRGCQVTNPLLIKLKKKKKKTMTYSENEKAFFLLYSYNNCYFTNEPVLSCNVKPD